MKNVAISNKTWKRLRQHRDDLELKHYNTIIEYFMIFYEINQSLLEEQNDEIMNKIKQEKSKIEYLMNKNERITYNKLKKVEKEKIYRGVGFPDFYHLEDGRLVVDEVKSESYSTLSENQKRLMKYLVQTGVRYRIWIVDKSGNTKIVYDSDNDKQTSLLEEQNDKKKYTDEDKMWNI